MQVVEADQRAELHARVDGAADRHREHGRRRPSSRERGDVRAVRRRGWTAARGPAPWRETCAHVDAGERAARDERLAPRASRPAPARSPSKPGSAYVPEPVMMPIAIGGGSYGRRACRAAPRPSPSAAPAPRAAASRPAAELASASRRAPLDVGDERASGTPDRRAARRSSAAAQISCTQRQPLLLGQRAVAVLGAACADSRRAPRCSAAGRRRPRPSQIATCRGWSRGIAAKTGARHRVRADASRRRPCRAAGAARARPPAHS